jgi:hypothetical protein
LALIEERRPSAICRAVRPAPRANEPDDRAAVGEDADYVGAANLVVEALVTYRL